MGNETVPFKISSLARQLRPHWKKDDEQVITRLRGGSFGNGNGGAGTGTMAVHELSGLFHTGTLANSQGPQFALLDGSRVYTGNIQFSGSQTVDGVDISDHAADPDRHHNRVTDGGGLIVSGGNTQIVSVNQAYNFTWTGTHTFHEDIQLNANLDFLGLREITSSDSNHLTLNPGGDLILPSNKTFRSSDYADGIPITGFSLFPDPSGDRQLTIFGIKADEMHVRAFVADMVRVDIGEEWWGKSLGLLYDDFTTPATIGGTAVMVLEDAPAIAGQLFSDGDWVMLRVIDIPAAGTTGETHIAYIWGQVSAYVDLPADENGIGRQQFTFTLRDGPFSTLIKKGSVVVNFAVSGQGYIHLSALDSAQGPWIQIGDWNGTDPYTAGNRKLRTQIGRLDGVSDPDLLPVGWGLYSDNAFLKGILRTPDTLVNETGVWMQQYDYASSETPGGSILAWVDDVNAVGDLTPPHQAFTINSYTNTDIAQDQVLLEMYKRPTSATAQLSLRAVSESQQATLALGAGGEMQLYSSISQIDVRGHLRPLNDLTYDLGTASLRWRNLYVDQIFVSGSISGDTLSGQEWEYPGSMIIDANSSGATTVSVTNQGTGTASLAVEGNITLGGTVDGVDVGAHAGNPSAHHAIATAGDGITVSGAQVVAVRLAAASGLAFASGQLLLADSVAGSGLLISGKVMTINAGSGLELVGDALSVDLAAVSGLAFASGELMLADSIAGSGLGITSKVLAVNTGDGIAIVSDAVAVDLAATSGLEFVAGELQIANSIAGNGLSIASKILAVNPGNGIEIVSDAVAIDLVGDSGLVVTVSGLYMGTPTTLDVLSTNTVTGATHAHNIDSAADVGTTPISKILHSTAAGGLTLGYLAVAGNVDITNNGDLDVANHTLFVDASANSVGIGGLPISGGPFPDPQFALDINGPARAQYWIGPHAIQLKDVVLLSHFDGKEPYNTNTTGEPNSTMGQVATVPNPLTTPTVFRPGKFFKAIEITRAATNLLSNPQFDGGSTSGWTDYVTGAATGSRTALATRQTYIGEYSYRLIKTGGADSDRWGTIVQFSVTSGLSYSLSVWVYASGFSGNKQIAISARGTPFSSETTIVTLPDSGESEGWIRLVVNATAIATGTGQLWVWIHDTPAGTLYLSAAQATQSAFAHPYTQSTRNATSLSYANLAIQWTRLTMMAWMYPAASPSEIGTALRVLILHKDASNFYNLLVLTSNLLQLSNAGGVIVNSGSVTVPGNAWTHVAYTIGGGIATLYINGAAVGSAAIASFPSGTLPTLYVGCSDTLASQLNGLLDDVVVIDRTLPAEEILSVYESNAPVFAESVRYSARFTQKGLGWFDDEGLWMKDSLGNAVMGFYGGEAANKSWAGTLLNPGDIFFGRFGASQGGWLRFDRDGSAGVPLFTLGYNEASVFELSSTTAKLQGVNLEIFNGSDEFLGVFATAPAGGTWAGATGVAAGDVLIGDYDRPSAGTGAAMWWDDNVGSFYIGQRPTAMGGTGSYLQAGANNVGIVRNGFWRVQATSAGLLTINNGSGQAVFSFDSSTGAEFTKPLTIGTAGGIYQGSGTFASPTTGLKIWSVDVSGTLYGKLAAFKTGVEQFTLDTDGIAKAGGGALTLDSNGMRIATGSGAMPQRAIEWQVGSTTIADVMALDTGSVDTLLLTVKQIASRAGAMTLETNAPTSQASTITLQTYVNLGRTAHVVVGDQAVLQASHNNATLTKPSLLLGQADLSEEFIEFSSTIGAGNPIDTAALGTYYGKVRVSVNGTFKFLALYNS